MKITIQAFGKIEEIIGDSDCTLDSVDTVQSLYNELAIQFPALANMMYAVAINNKIANPSSEIKEGDSIALLPPFSGG